MRLDIGTAVSRNNRHAVKMPVLINNLRIILLKEQRQPVTVLLALNNEYKADVKQVIGSISEIIKNLINIC